MPDWLTHALVGYALATALGLRADWLDARYVTLAMVGALLPDLAKLDLLVPSDAVAATLGTSFDWFALHTLGGTAVTALAVAALLPAEHRRRGLLVLALGATSHHALDLLLVQPSGLTYPVLWPLSDLRVPSVDLYLSSDREPAIAAAVLALAARYAAQSGSAGPPERPTRQNR